MLDGCPIQRGFFALRPCGGAPVQLCPACGRAVCMRHWQLSEVGGQCVECASRTFSSTQDDAWYDGNSGYHYRDHYYRSSHYTPVGVVGASTFDDQDYRSVDPPVGGAQQEMHDRDDALGSNDLNDPNDPMNS